MCDLDREFRMKYDDSLEVGRKKLPNATIFNYVTAMDIEDYRIGKLQSGISQQRRPRDIFHKL